MAAPCDEHGAEAVRAEGRRSHPRVCGEDPAVQADAGAEAGAEGHRRGHAAAAADAPAAAGRRRRGQDDRRAAGGDCRHGKRPAGGVHGADGNPGGAALRQHRPAAVAVAFPGGHPHGQHARPEEAHVARTHRARDDEPDRRDARAGPGVDRVPQARTRRHRRAAPLRCRAACRAPREGPEAGRAADDGDADSANARAHRLQRARRLEDPRPATRAETGADVGEAGIAARRDLRRDSRAARRRTPGVHHLPARRGVREDRPQVRDRHGRPSADGNLPGLSRRAPARAHEAGREGQGDARLRGRAGAHPRVDDRRRSRRRRAERVDHGGGARRAIRPLAAASAARPRRTRRMGVALLPDVSGAVDR